MGVLRSATDHAGLVVGKVTLGQPAPLAAGEPCAAGEEPDEYVWSDSRLPNGTVDEAGAVTVNEPEQ